MLRLLEGTEHRRCHSTRGLALEYAQTDVVQNLRNFVQDDLQTHNKDSDIDLAGTHLVSWCICHIGDRLARIHSSQLPPTEKLVTHT